MSTLDNAPALIREMAAAGYTIVEWTHHGYYQASTPDRSSGAIVYVTAAGNPNAASLWVDGSDAAVLVKTVKATKVALGEFIAAHLAREAAKPAPVVEVEEADINPCPEGVDVLDWLLANVGNH